MSELYIYAFRYPLLTILLLFPLVAVASYLGTMIMARTLKFAFRSKHLLPAEFNWPKFFLWPLSFAIWSGLIYVLEVNLHLLFSPDVWKSFAADLFAITFIVSVAFCIFRCFKIFSIILRKKFDISVSENFRQRKVITQLQYIEKIFLILLVFISLGFVLLRFDTLAKLGGGVLASAGLASVILGFAAQESVSNLIAGFQIAFTQPLRIDDAVVVENEWGWIEEINLTYVVIRLWDLRRLVLPIKYFTTQPFQNWTRQGAQVIGSIFFHVDHKADVETIRNEFERIVKASPLWDGHAQVLQVTEVKEHSMELRALASARTSPQAWDLRCEIREKVITFLQKNHPEFLTQNRYLKMRSASQKNEGLPK